MDVVSKLGWFACVCEVICASNWTRTSIECIIIIIWVGGAIVAVIDF